MILLPLMSLAQPSILKNKQAYALTEQALQSIYNVDIEKSEALSQQIEQLMPNYPVNPMLDALTIRAAYYPLEPNSKEFAQMKQYLEEVARQADDILDQDEDHAEANFFALAAHGLLAMYESEDGNQMQAIGEAKSAYKYLKRGFDLKEQYPDFYFSTGLYNYYREKYPELHPFYKSFVWFFKSGDKALGLQQMKKANQESLFMGPESADYLTHIYLFYENQPQQALTYARQLVNKYPNNLYFVVNYTHAALASGNFAGIEPYIERLISSDKRYFQVVGYLFQGMLLEKRDQQWDEAEQFYIKSLSANTGIQGEEAENYRSYAYAGLARIADHEQKRPQAKSLYQKALDTAQYPPVAQEAEAYLN